LYARAQGESDEIADAVYDHYRPVGLMIHPAQSKLAALLRLRTNRFHRWGVSLWEWCPRLERSYALRRAALGIVRSFWRRSCPFSLTLAIGAAAKALLAHNPSAPNTGPGKSNP